MAGVAEAMLPSANADKCNRHSLAVWQIVARFCTCQDTKLTYGIERERTNNK